MLLTVCSSLDDAYSATRISLPLYKFLIYNSFHIITTLLLTKNQYVGTLFPMNNARNTTLFQTNNIHNTTFFLMNSTAKILIIFEKVAIDCKTVTCHLSCWGGKDKFNHKRNSSILSGVMTLYSASG